MHNHKKRSYYLLFHSIHDVLKAEKRLKAGGFSFELMPIPRNLSSDCGSCIRLYDEFEDARPCIHDIVMERSFLFDGEEFKALEQNTPNRG